jgi:chaperonin cofactor prefoldin
MTGETERDVSGWTTDTLKVFHDEKLSALGQLAAAETARVADRLEAIEKVIDLLQSSQKVAQEKFEAQVSARFVAVNEFRGSLDDLSKQMATRRELETLIASNSTVIDDLRKMIAELRSRIDVGPSQIPELEKFVALTGGRMQGVEHSTDTLAKFLPILIAVVALITTVYIATH